MSELMVGSVAIAALLVCVLAGMHISFAMFGISIVSILYLTEFGVTEALVASTVNSSVSKLTYAVIPMFLLMGAFMTSSRGATDLYALMYFVVKKIRGGLAVATVGANAAFASVTGVSIASAVVFSRVAYPQMKARKYADSLTLGSIAGSSILGMLIPPSVLMILYGILTQVSIGAMFLAGIVPGLILALMFAAMVVATAYLKPQLVGMEKGADGTWANAASVPDESGPEQEKFLPILLRTGPVGLIFVVVIGGIWGGFFTPTEAGAIGAAAAMIVGFATGMTRLGFMDSLHETAVTTGSILILLIGAHLYSRMLSLTGMVSWLGEKITSLDISATTFLILTLLVVLVMGAFLDSASIMLLTLPIIFPVVTALGIDPVWFGITFIVAVEIGLITPPFGMVIFAMAGALGRQVEVAQIFKGSMPFIFVMIVFIAMLFAVPEIATWLPGLMRT